MFRKKWIWFYVILCAASVGLMLYPEIGEDTLVEGTDMGFHVARILSLSQSLKSGVFPVKLHSSLCYTYGYGLGFFYPQLFLYFPAALIALGMEVITAVKVFLLFIMTGTFIISARSIFVVSDNHVISGIAGVMMTLSFYEVQFLYRVAWVGVLLGTPFLLATLCYEIAILSGKRNDNRAAAAFSATLLLTLESHSTTFILLCIAVAAVFVLSLPLWMRRKNAALRLIGGVSRLQFFPHITGCLPWSRYLTRRLRSRGHCSIRHMKAYCHSPIYSAAE